MFALIVAHPVSICLQYISVKLHQAALFRTRNCTRGNQVWAISAEEQNENTFRSLCSLRDIGSFAKPSRPSEHTKLARKHVCRRRSHKMTDMRSSLKITDKTSYSSKTPASCASSQLCARSMSNNVTIRVNQLAPNRCSLIR